MYSWQIAETLEKNDYNIDSETFIKIINESSQIDHSKYTPYGDCFEIWTDDGYYWRFQVYEKEKKYD